MKFTIQRDKNEEVKLQLTEHLWGVSVSVVGSNETVIDFYNDGGLYVMTKGAELFNCGTGKVTK